MSGFSQHAAPCIPRNRTVQPPSPVFAYFRARSAVASSAMHRRRHVRRRLSRDGGAARVFTSSSCSALLFLVSLLASGHAAPRLETNVLPFLPRQLTAP